MKLVEIRDLDGPNLFLLQPAIKLELRLGEADHTGLAAEQIARQLDSLGVSDELEPEERDRPEQALIEFVRLCHARARQSEPEVQWVEMETAGQFSLVWPWEHRAFALGVAELTAAIATGDPNADDPADLLHRVEALASLLEDPAPDDRPLMIRDEDRAIPAIGITGTNGKTTTTRLIAHILRGAGLHPGWSSTSGVYVDGEQVLEGDYSGPSGARRILQDPGVDVAILETARGGILLRGLACESNDIGVFTNVSGDHLGLHGIHTVEGLAKVKSVVVRVTKPGGWVVLNADDPLVRGAAAMVHASRFWVTQNPDNPHVVAHIAGGGRALVADEREIVEYHGERQTPMAALADIPFTFGGKARHMVENALCAAAACLAFERTPEEVAVGLRTFGDDPADNPGRNQVFHPRGGTVIIDYAHNASGLRHLLALARSLCAEGGRLTAIVGSAGDRDDEAIRMLGQIAAELSDRVIVKETQRYLRGRENVAEINQLIIEGIGAGGQEPAAVVPSEVDAVKLAVADLQPGDTVAVMSFEDATGDIAYLESLGE